MRTVVEITLPPIPYDQNIADVMGYLQMVLSEMTESNVTVHVNDYDFTDKIGIFNKNRRPSVFNRG